MCRFSSKSKQARAWLAVFGKHRNWELIWLELSLFWWCDSGTFPRHLQVISIPKFYKISIWVTLSFMFLVLVFFCCGNLISVSLSRSKPTAKRTIITIVMYQSSESKNCFRLCRQEDNRCSTKREVFEGSQQAEKLQKDLLFFFNSPWPCGNDSSALMWCDRRYPSMKRSFEKGKGPTFQIIRKWFESWWRNKNGKKGICFLFLSSCHVARAGPKIADTPTWGAEVSLTLYRQWTVLPFPSRGIVSLIENVHKCLCSCRSAFIP